MAVLEPYTSTYTDVDGSIMDASDLVDEFYRVAYFLRLWGGVIDAIGQPVNYEEYVEVVEGQLAEILPARGHIQRFEVAPDVEQFELAVREHTVGAPFRVYISIRCRSKDTRFTVSSPTNQSHTFSVNRTVYMPSQQVAADPVGRGVWFSAFIICTYGATEGVMVQVFAANPEEEAVSNDDVLQLVAR